MTDTATITEQDLDQDCPEWCGHGDGTRCAEGRAAIHRMEAQAEGAVERYLEGGWDTTGEYSYDPNDQGGWAGTGQELSAGAVNDPCPTCSHADDHIDHRDGCDSCNDAAQLGQYAPCEGSHQERERYLARAGDQPQGLEAEWEVGRW